MKKIFVTESVSGISLYTTQKLKESGFCILRINITNFFNQKNEIFI
jgi:hypothetical protein